jgi:hypothetical protein
LRDFFLTRFIATLVCIIALDGGHLPASAQTPGKPAGGANPPITAAEKSAASPIMLPPSPKALLPDDFDGWVADVAAKPLTDPSQADPSGAAALKEYGFTFGVEKNYKREGETIALRALRFQDSSGAYGAYSYYRQNGWAKEQIGTGGASFKNRVLFWRGETVVDATFSRIGPMSAGELREIAGHLSVPTGNRAIAPPIMALLPQSSLDAQSTHYAEGPAGYAGSGGVLPPSLAGFDRGAEAVTSNYALPSGPATLTLLEYPTPQIAEAQETAIRNYLKASSQAQPPWPKPLVDSDQASLEVRRSDVLVAVVSGDAIPNESHRLLESVHYEANLISIPQPVESDVLKTSRLLISIATFVVVGSLAAILLGFFLGGGRALYRVARGRPASSVYDEEFIHLDLREEWKEKPIPVTSPNPEG